MDPQQLKGMKRALGRRLAGWRKTRGLIQDDVARLVHSTRSTVAGVERGEQVVDRVFWVQCETLLRTGGELINGYDEYRALEIRHQEEKAEAARRARWGALALVDSVRETSAPDRGEEVVESVADVRARVRDQQTGLLDESFLASMELFIDEAVDGYEMQGPQVLAPIVVRERRRIQRILLGRVRPKQQQRLLGVAGRLSGLLSYMSVNLGRYDSARAYALESFQLAEQADDGDLRAWVRGTQSLAEFYAGNYREALAFAEDGRRYASTGRQAVRLVVNGEARAHGKLGDRRAVTKAVAEAYELLGAFAPEPGMTPCISFGVYSEARTASNAATAYLGLGHTEPVLEFAERALDIVDGSPSRWSQALVRLDMAAALIDTPTPDVDRALSVARQAMSAAEGNRIESIEQRLRSFVAGLQANAEYAPVAAFVEEARLWLRQWKPDDGTPSPEPRTGSGSRGYVDQDWLRYRTLGRLIDHWDRKGWSPGRRSYHWIMCLGRHQALRELANECQTAMRDIPTLDMVPLDGLHLTIQRVGFTDEVPPAQLTPIVRAARSRLATISPITLRVGPLAGSAGAVRFSAGPHGPVRSVRQAVRQALAENLGEVAVPVRATEFVPHVSIAYNHAPTTAAPVIDRVASLRSIPAVTVTIPSVELVELRRERRSYVWDVLAVTSLSGDEEYPGSDLPRPEAPTTSSGWSVPHDKRCRRCATSYGALHPFT